MDVIKELRLVIYGLKMRAIRERRTHFCQHHGIYIYFERARSNWYALLPSTVRPWHLHLRTVRRKNKDQMNKKNTIKLEVEENA